MNHIRSEAFLIPISFTLPRAGASSRTLLRASPESHSSHVPPCCPQQWRLPQCPQSPPSSSAIRPHPEKIQVFPNIFKLLIQAFPLQSRLMRRIEQLYKIMCEYLAPNTQNKSNPSFFYLFHSMFFRFGFFGFLADPLHQRRDLRLGLRVVKRHPPGGASGSCLSKVGGQT